MIPLHNHFPRLKPEEIAALLAGVDRDAISCVNCNREAIRGYDCDVCPFKGRKTKDILIESFIPLVMSIARRFGGENRQEIIGVGLLALTETVVHVPGDIRSLEAYIRSSVTGKIKNFLVTNTTIRVPPYGSVTHGRLRRTPQLTGEAATHGEQGLVDLYEILDKIPRNKNEEVILRCMAEGGYSLADMAERCNLSTPRVSQIKQSLLERVFNKTKEILC